MLPSVPSSSTKSSIDYTPVPFSDNDSGISSDDGFPSEPKITMKKQSPMRYFITMKIPCLILIGVLIGVAIGFSAAQDIREGWKRQAAQAPISSSSKNSKSCTEPRIRREWRSLSKAEKSNYLSAVKCLAETPSRLRSNGTVYDDFPWAHSHVAHITHGAAPFFTWHRYFIHIYETTLKDICGYRGSLPYWDWTLDWESLGASPIFSPSLGFGGDGVELPPTPDAPVTVGYGHCVASGPFADFRPMFYKLEDRPHCLSRGFTANFSGYGVRPEAVEAVGRETEYSDFFLAMENGPHNVIPNEIRGDFYQFTAPYDPLFYLHHAQLDRLWWQWQLRNGEENLWKYGGKAAPHSPEQATLDDVLPYAGLARDVIVGEIMQTEGEVLCYRYF